MIFFLNNMDTIVPLCLGIIAALYFIYTKQKPVLIDKIILVFFSSQVFLNTVSGILYYFSINNMVVYSLNVLVFAGLFSYYFYRSLTGKKIKKLVQAGLLLFLLFFVFNLLFLQPINSFNSYSYAFVALLITLFTLVGLKQLLNRPIDLDILQLKDFWLAAGTLLYFGSSFFIFISYNYLSVVSVKDVSVLWKIHNLFLAVSCLIFFKAIMSKAWIPK